jgi:hypothetical protein
LEVILAFFNTLEIASAGAVVKSMGALADELQPRFQPWNNPNFGFVNIT